MAQTEPSLSVLPDKAVPLPFSATGSLAAALLPFALYVFTAGGESYWLDSPEFVAAAIDLDIPHPPGHPLASLWGKLFSLLPVGPLPFRVALSQAFATAVALACAQRAMARSIVYLGLSRRAAQVSSVGAAWLLAGSFGFWFQSVRPEVYALAAMLVCFALERLSVLATRHPSEPLDARPFYAATLAVGLGLANHHFISILALPAFLWPLVTLMRAQGLRPLLWGSLTGLLGLCTYAYLPLRAARLPPMDFGHPVTPGAMFWVASAQVYAKKIGTEAIQPLGERFFDLSVILVENLRVPMLLALPLGIYLLLRARRTWPLAALWIITAIVSLAGRAYLNPVRSNPDVLGYMMPGFVAGAALALCGLSLVIVQLGVRIPVYKTHFERALCCLCVGAGVWALTQGFAPASLAQFRAPDLFDEIRYRRLPERSVVVLLTPQTVFRHFGAQAVEATRSDVLMVPTPFLDYGKSGEELGKKQPELAALIRSFSATQRLSKIELDALLAKHPVLIEPDASFTLPLFPWLIPNGLYFELRSEPPTALECEKAAEEREALFDWLYAAMGADALELETRRQLLWIHYNDALFFAHRGMHREARMAIQRGLKVEPLTRELKALEAALKAAGSAPVDVQPFILLP